MRKIVCHGLRRGNRICASAWAIVTVFVTALLDGLPARGGSGAAFLAPTIGPMTTRGFDVKQHPAAAYDFFL